MTTFFILLYSLIEFIKFITLFPLKYSFIKPVSLEKMKNGPINIVVNTQESKRQLIVFSMKNIIKKDITLVI